MSEKMTDVEFYMKQIRLEDRKKKISSLKNLEDKILYNFSGKNANGSWKNVILTKEEGSLILNTLLRFYGEDVKRLEEELHGIDGCNVERTIV